MDLRQDTAKLDLYHESYGYIPEGMRYFVRGGPDVQPDERIAVGYEIMCSPVSHVCSLLYPSVYPLGQMKGGWPKGSNGKVRSLS